MMTIAGYVVHMYNLPKIEEETFKFVYASNKLPFNYYVNVLIPQVASVLLIYACYLLINRVVVSSVKKVITHPPAIVILKSIALLGATIIMLAFILAVGNNIATWYAHPYFFNYRNFGFLALMGYNDHPLKNLFDGFGGANAFIGIYALFACAREGVIYYIQKSGIEKPYKILIANQVSVFMVGYLAFFLFIELFDIVHENAFFTTYFSFITPVALVFFSNTYWLFPLKQQHSFLQPRILTRLLISTLICTLPFALYLADKYHPFVFLIYWAVQLLVVTPVTWIFYQQRKDKILQLLGANKALAKSKTDLQFLRSQINPHFLFNTLNTLYGTALTEGADRTAEGIQKLGDMMRFMLHENNMDAIPMSKEIEYLQNYIALQKLRAQSSPDILIGDNINQQVCPHNIAPMLLIPLVENAFKHGISLKERSWIKIELTCDDKNILFSVSNTMHARIDNDPEKSGSGVGLKNVADRLALLYAGRYKFNAAANGNEFTATMQLFL